MENGLYEANLGGNVYKKRIPLAGRGKRGGARALVAFKLHKTAIFVYGFTKNEKGNISNAEKEALQALAKLYFSYSKEELNQAIRAGKLIEVRHEKIYP